MLAVLLIAQIAVTQPVTDTATYSPPGVRDLVARAAERNTQVPAALGRYRASVESEVSYGNQSADREIMASIEQMSSTLTWKRNGDFEQHVTGYRSQSVGPQMATLGFFRSAWVVPSLYGNRLSLLFGRDTSARRSRFATRPNAPYIAVHPLSADRERYYRFAGGDTVQHLLVDGREIRIVRVAVEPRPELPAGTYFSGEINLDIERHHVVRMRGTFLTTRDGPRGPMGLFRLVQLEGIAFVELVNSEVEQQFWLPSYQRLDAHALAPTLTDAKAVFRIVSRFHDYDIDPPDAVAGVTAADTLRSQVHRLSLAPRDSLALFAAWREDIGAASTGLSATDFDSLAPPRWRPTGPPIAMVQSERLSDVVRYNRVEGAYTGLGAVVRFRDAAPGVVLRGTAGYAWSERTVRGRAAVHWDRGPWTLTARAGRSLDNTNDFRTPFDSGASIGALFGIDDYDYVDRTFAGLAATRTAPRNRWLLRIETGWSDDRAARMRATHAPVGGNRFYANRGVDEGGWLRSAATVRWNPAVSAEFIEPGVGAGVDYVRGDGTLAFQRVEATASARINPGRWTLAARFDAGAAFGSVPPQQLFEIGSEHNLPGYDYKEFAGNQAVVVRGLAMWRTNRLTAPVRLFRRFWLPAPSPALTASLQGGWTGASDAGARAAILRLGTRFPVDPTDLASYAPASTVTGDFRATVAAGLRFFGGAIGVVVARPVDRPAPWKLQVAIGQLF